MRKTITTCIIAGIMMSQASEPKKAQADQLRTTMIAMNEAMHGEMSIMCIEKNEICEAPDMVLEDQELVERAIEVCYPDVKKIPQAYYANAETLLKVEHSMSIPDVMRGMTLAAACVESGFNANAEGDHRFSKDGKTPMAIGILQMWPLYERAYNVNRRDVTSSAKGWLTHIKRQTTSVKKNCHTNNDEDMWRLAWVQGVRAPKKGGRCNENVSHWYVFKKIKGKLTRNHT